MTQTGSAARPSGCGGSCRRSAAAPCASFARMPPSSARCDACLPHLTRPPALSQTLNLTVSLLRNLQVAEHYVHCLSWHACTQWPDSSSTHIRLDLEQCHSTCLDACAPPRCGIVTRRLRQMSGGRGCAPTWHSWSSRRPTSKAGDKLAWASSGRSASDDEIEALRSILLTIMGAAALASW